MWVSHILSQSEKSVYSYIEPGQHCSLPQLQATRALSGTSVPIIAMLILPSSFLICYFGPESLGGVGDFGKRVDDEAARIGVPADELGNEVRRFPVL